MSGTAARERGGPPSSQETVRRPSRVTLAIGAEVNNLAPKLEAANTYAAEINFLTNSPLVVLEPAGTARPLLAAEIPSQANGTWVVNPDSTMRTTWRLNPTARWHDGAPVTSRDFVFTLGVYHDEAIPSRDRLPERYMDRIEPLDDRTFAIVWSQPYPWANELILHQLAPLPAHVLSGLYDAGPDAFLASPFWASTAYVGNGPFKLVQWDPGSQMLFEAYADYFKGRPALDEILVRIIGDDSTLVANVLGGAIDATLGSTLDQQGGATIRKQWEQSGDGVVIITPTNFRHLRFQYDPQKNRQPALLDARVRRALAHAIDRDTLAEVVSEGSSRATEVPLTPADPLYAPATQAVAHNPYDPARSRQLLGNLGWSARADGVLAGPQDQPFTVDLREGQGADTEAEGAIVAADLGKVGVQVNLELIPQSRIRDLEYRASFPGMASGSLPVGLPRALDFGISSQCANAERRYAGVNRGCWTNPDFDRMYDTVTTALDPTVRANALIQALKIATEEVGVIGLAYQTQAFAVRKGLVGPVSRWPSQSGSTWNVHEWRVE